MGRKKGLVFGVGVNDADYAVCKVAGGKFSHCQFYSTWHHVLSRCYSKRYQSKYPTYIGCTVCDEWLIFSNFKKWMEAQDWRGKQLDKDLIKKGNKVYSPSTCAFVDQALNKFTNERGLDRGEFPIGVSFHKHIKKYQSCCRNPLSGKRECLGYFDNPVDAHNAWKRRKMEIAFILADMQKDERVAKSLRERYL